MGKYNRNSVKLTASLMGLLLLSACSVTKTVIDTKSPLTVKRSVQDLTAARAIRARMKRVETHNLDNVSVDVVEGQVLLAGAVLNDESRQVAEKIAWSAPSVRKVGNEVQIGYSPSLGSKVSDELISTSVRTKMATSNNVRNLNYEVETRNRIVYLMGVARSEDELKEAARLASITRGVKEVVSYVRIGNEMPNSYGAGYAGDSMAAPSSITTPSPSDVYAYPQGPISDTPPPDSTLSAPQTTNLSDPIPFEPQAQSYNEQSLNELAGESWGTIDDTAPLPYRPGITELDADALDSGKPFLRDPYTGEIITLPDGVKPLPYIPPGPGSLGEGAKPLPPGAQAKIASQEKDVTTPLAGGGSVTLTAPYTIDPKTGSTIPVKWDGKQWIGLTR